jgi:glycine/D-amino acid oxidase-like deaminating enzyme|tara:strand:+ start:136 stop:1416 length:1281 start_codon:yes stop_codon:yes gene_type:complete
MKVGVIGAGIIGSAIAWELRKRGAEVTVFEKLGDAGHGSTSASCGIIRRCYSQTSMIKLSNEASEIWAEWENWLGPIEGSLARFERPGMLLIPSNVDEGFLQVIEEMKKSRVKAEFLDKNAINEKFPFLNTEAFFPSKPVSDDSFFNETGELQGGVWEEDAGYVVSPGLANTNLKLAAQRDGVEFLFNTEVCKVEHDGGAPYSIVTNAGQTHEFDVMVNAAGPWSSKINQLAGVELPLENRALRREVHAMKNPVFGKHDMPVVGDLDSGTYFRPETGGIDIVIGSTDPECDEKEWVENPDEVDIGLTETYWERQVLRTMRRIPKLQMGKARGLAHMYDVTLADWYPTVDRTDIDGWYVALGTSGSSFKTAPMIGVMMAEIVYACENGHDHDNDPVILDLPRIGLTVDTSFLSRLRSANATTGTVFG